MGEVVLIDIPTKADVPPDNVLSGALTHHLETAMVIGWDGNGDLYLASSTGDIGDILVLLEVAKRETLDQIE